MVISEASVPQRLDTWHTQYQVIRQSVRTTDPHCLPSLSSGNLVPHSAVLPGREISLAWRKWITFYLLQFHYRPRRSFLISFFPEFILETQCCINKCQPRNGLQPAHSTLPRRSLHAKRHTALRYRRPCSCISPIREVRIALRRFAPNSESF